MRLCVSRLWVAFDTNADDRISREDLFQWRSATCICKFCVSLSTEAMQGVCDTFQFWGFSKIGDLDIVCTLSSRILINYKNPQIRYHLFGNSDIAALRQLAGVHDEDGGGGWFQRGRGG